MKDKEHQSNNIRIKEISAQLAEMKRSFFVDHVEHPMSMRVTLEAELANLKLEQLRAKTTEAARVMQVKQLRAEILKTRLVDLGYPNLLSECNELAERQISDEVTQ